MSNQTNQVNKRFRWRLWRKLFTWNLLQRFLELRKSDFTFSLALYFVEGDVYFGWSNDLVYDITVACKFSKFGSYQKGSDLRDAPLQVPSIWGPDKFLLDAVLDAVERSRVEPKEQNDSKTV